MNKSRITLLIATALISICSHAETYKCQINGKVVFSDKPGENCEPIQVRPVIPNQSEVERERNQWRIKAEQERKNQELAQKEQKNRAKEQASAQQAKIQREQAEWLRRQREFDRQIKEENAPIPLAPYEEK